MVPEEGEEPSFMDQYGLFMLIGVGLLLLVGGILYGSSEESVGERAGFLGRILGRLKIA